MAGLLQNVADVFEPPAGIISKPVQILAMNKVDQEIRNVADGFFVPQIELLHRTVSKLMKDRTHRMVGRDGGPFILNHGSPLSKNRRPNETRA
jgi:hypothetical protein